MAIERITAILKTGGPVVWIIAGLSIMALAVVLERLAFFIRSGEKPEPLEQEIGRLVMQGEKDKALLLCREKKTSLRRLFLSALNHWEVDMNSMKLLLEGQVRSEVYRWTKGLSVLSVIARIAPLLGLLGTVLGMVEIFQNLPKTDQAPMIALAGGIWKALLTTVAGLSVAVPAVLCHSLFSSKVDDLEETLSRAADFIIGEKAGY